MRQSRSDWGMASDLAYPLAVDVQDFDGKRISAL